MAEHTLYGKKKLCYTEVTDFTDFQGIGRDPLYKRFDSVYSVIDKNIEPQYKDFLAHPIYSDEDQILWYVREWDNAPCAYNDLSDEDKMKYSVIKDETIAAYEKVRKTLVGEDKQILTGALKFIDENFMFCYDDKIVLVAWGMSIDSHKYVVKGSVIHDLKLQKNHKIRFNVGDNGMLADKLAGIVSRPDGFTLSHIDLPKVTPKEGYIFKGWDPNPIGIKVNEPKTFTALYEEQPNDLVKVKFIANEGGALGGETEFTINKGTVLDASQIPSVFPNTGFTFVGWDIQPDSQEINNDITFCASFKQDTVECRFLAGEYGSIEGSDSIILPKGATLSLVNIPKVKVKKGYKFIGWDKTIDNIILNEDNTLTAQYEKTKPWYSFIFNKGCWLKLLWLLLFLLVLFLLFWLLKDASCTRNVGDDIDDREHQEIVDGNPDPYDLVQPGIEDPVHDPFDIENPVGIYNPDNPYLIPPTDPAYGDVLPPEQGVLPPVSDDDIDLENPGIISNRLNILMENEDKSVGDLARAFKQHYPGEEYQVIYYDDIVKRIQILVPPQMREVLKQQIPSKLSPEFEVFVFDETLFELSYTPNDPVMSSPEKSWYLNAIKAKEAWDITRGSENVVVAVVDNGFNLSHPELQSKVYKPYNVWKHNNDITANSDCDHGTHVAGIALAVGDNGIGISGIAPRCKFMPVQVADNNGRMSLTAVLDGILYSIYQGAHVVNVSLGYTITSLLNTPETIQKEFINSRLKEEERLWCEVTRIASTKNVTLVVSAGNDNVLAGIDPLQRPDDIIVVSALDKDLSNLEKAGFSNYGDYSTVSAPGVSIYSTLGSSGYDSMDGTSMAAPIITGSIALMKSLSPNITTKQIKCVFKRTSLPVNDKVPGLIQLNKALSVVKNANYSNCEVEPSTGDVQIKLSWDNYNDIDLICVEPNGQKISYKNKRSSTGGMLEIDMNVSYPDSNHPLENIYWPVNGAPSGTYYVYVNYFNKHEDPTETPYKVMVKHGNSIEEYTGMLTQVKETKLVCSFTLGDNNEVDDSNGIRDSLLRKKRELEDSLTNIKDQLRNLN